ncbi:MAG: BREX-4 system phosphatase PglZ [Selenomonadaceae bacterium]|nr:BREX-4 system phosphatase PglZ [Selenomonadaceae bacterium]
MKKLSVDEAVKKIRIYLGQSFFRPYFVVSDGVKECEELQKNFKDFERICISDFCVGDFLLDTDLLIEKLKVLEKNALCFGLGEYIFFTGQENILRVLQDKNFSRKIIFVCRGISNLLERFADSDFKFRTNNFCKMEGTGNFFVVKYGENINIETDAKNFAELLKIAENGKNNFITVKSDLPIKNVKEIKSFYDAIKSKYPNFTIPPDALNEKQWQEYFFDDKCEGYPPEHWRSFAAGFKNNIGDSYLKFVFECSSNYTDYQRNLFFALLDVKDEKIFDKFYLSRKSAVKNISSQYISEYIRRLKNFSAGSNLIKYLTDNTAEERHEMIKAVQGKEKIPSILEKNYVSMKEYLSDYEFVDEEITKYFRRYKKIKLCNMDDKNFKNLVKEIALARPYNKFETRRAILDKSDENAKLYWLDALGVEFLGYIQSQATKLEFSAEIKIARAELPTLTSQNKNFYEDWQGDKFIKNQKLDELKHSPENFGENGKCSVPLYIDEEFKIINGVLDEIKNDLINHKSKKIILTSDHGASRLAVMYGRENKYKMNSAGEQSGRCCPINEMDEKPNCAAEENGYWATSPSCLFCMS